MDAIHFSQLDADKVKSLRLFLYVSRGDLSPQLLDGRWFVAEDLNHASMGTRLAETELAFLHTAIQRVHEVTFTAAYSKCIG